MVKSYVINTIAILEGIFIIAENQKLSIPFSKLLERIKSNNALKLSAKFYENLEKYINKRNAIHLLLEPESNRAQNFGMDTNDFNNFEDKGDIGQIVTLFKEMFLREELKGYTDIENSIKALNAEYAENYK